MASGLRTLGEIAAANLAARYAADAGKERPGLKEYFRAHRRSADACVVVVCLAIAWERGAGENGRPTQGEYARYWGHNGESGRRQVEREWALIRDAFPGETGPERLAEQLVTRRMVRERSTPELALSLPADLLAA